MIYYWAALSPPAFTWMLEFFCMIIMYNEIQPWIDDYQVFVWVLVGLHHSFVIIQLGSWKYLIKILFQHWFVSLDFLFCHLTILTLHPNNHFTWLETTRCYSWFDLSRVRNRRHSLVWLVCFWCLLAVKWETLSSDSHSGWSPEIIEQHSIN